MNLAYFVLVSFGMTQILVYGKIFEQIRPTQGWVGTLWSCPMCMGFWVGVFLWGINGQTQLFSFELSPITGFLLGCLSSGTCYVLSMLIDDGGIRITL
jgi:hypothetical protein